MTEKNKPQKRVLMYDDDPDILEICSIILQAKGFIVDCKSNCTEVIKDIEHFGPTAILMDNWIPDIGGVKAVQLIKASPFKAIPVVFFSANTHVEELAKKAGAEFILKKPFDVSSLESMLEAAEAYGRIG